MSTRLTRRTGRGLRTVVLVVLMLFAAIVAPIAVPLRMVVERVRRDTRRTEQVVPRVASSGQRLVRPHEPPLPSTG